MEKSSAGEVKLKEIVSNEDVDLRGTPPSYVASPVERGESSERRVDTILSSPPPIEDASASTSPAATSAGLADVVGIHYEYLKQNLKDITLKYTASKKDMREGMSNSDPDISACGTTADEIEAFCMSMCRSMTFRMNLMNSIAENDGEMHRLLVSRYRNVTDTDMRDSNAFTAMALLAKESNRHISGGLLPAYKNAIRFLEGVSLIVVPDLRQSMRREQLALSEINFYARRMQDLQQKLDKLNSGLADDSAGTKAYNTESASPLGFLWNSIVANEKVLDAVSQEDINKDLIAVTATWNQAISKHGILRQEVLDKTELMRHKLETDFQLVLHALVKVAAPPLSR